MANALGMGSSPAQRQAAPASRGQETLLPMHGHRPCIAWPGVYPSTRSVHRATPPRPSPPDQRQTCQRPSLVHPPCLAQQQRGPQAAAPALEAAHRGQRYAARTRLPGRREAARCWGTAAAAAQWTGRCWASERLGWASLTGSGAADRRSREAGPAAHQQEPGPSLQAAKPQPQPLRALSDLPPQPEALGWTGERELGRQSLQTSTLAAGNQCCSRGRRVQPWRAAVPVRSAGLGGTAVPESARPS